MTTKRKYKNYTDGTTTVHVYDGDNPPEGFWRGRHTTPWNKGLSAKTDERVRANVETAHATRNRQYHAAWNKGLTKETDARVASYAQCLAGENNPMYGKHRVAWNKGLTKENDIRMKKASDNHKGVVAWNKGLSVEGHPHSVETREKIKQTHLNPEFKQARYVTMLNNGTLCVKESNAEHNFYMKLLQKYEESDIIRQYFDKERYPYKCDFYIVSEDKFIEINANWTHGGRPFDVNDLECINKLSMWQKKAETSRYYKNAIYTWTDLDVRKLHTAIENKLNFEFIY